jgi:hypothetical protein
MHSEMYRSHTHTHSFIACTFIFYKINYCFDGILFYYTSDLIYYMLRHYVKYETRMGEALL